jgi:hypothetical protein
MKRIILACFAAAWLFGQAKPDLQVEYTKALLDLANAQSGRLQMLEQIKKAQAESDESLVRSQNVVQAVLQKKSAECAAMKPPQQIDGDALQNKGLLACKEGAK